MNPNPLLQGKGAAPIGTGAAKAVCWGNGIFHIFDVTASLVLDASDLRELRDTLNRLMPPESSIQPIITKIRAMQDSSATQCNPAGPERARFDALTDVIVMLEDLEEGQ